MNNWDPRKIYKEVMSWAEVAIREQGALAIESKPDNTIVTNVDIKIESMASKYFTDMGGHLIGEETVKEKSKSYLEKAFKGEAYILDPIDGTCPYSTLQPLWGISLGYAVNSDIKEGIIVLPATNEVIVTDGSRVLYGKGRDKLPNFDMLHPIDAKQSVEACHYAGRQVVIAQSIFKKRYLGDSKLNFGAFYSCVYPIVYLALGRFKAMGFILNIWDFSAGMAIFSKLGFYMGLEDGTQLSLSIKEHFDWSRLQEGKVLSKQALYFAPDKKTAETVIEQMRFKSKKQ